MNCAKQALNCNVKRYIEISTAQVYSCDKVRLLASKLLNILKCISQKFFNLKFPKFTVNLAISLLSCQSNCELENKVVNFTLNFIGS